jgi:hypothetical protein
VCNEELCSSFSSYYVQDIYTYARMMPFFAQNIVVFLTDITVHGNQNIEELNNFIVLIFNSGLVVICLVSY